MKANKFFVTNLGNPSEIVVIKQSISSHEGINAVRVDMQASTVTVDYDEARYNEGEIAGFVSKTGLNVKQVK